MNYEQFFEKFNVRATRQERDAEISNLKAQLSLKEAEAAKAIRLLGFSSLQLSCDELSIRASTLDFEKKKLVDQVSQLEVVSDKVAELDADLMGMALHLDEEFYPRYLTTIAGQRVPVMATTTALSTTFVHDSTIPLVLAVDHEASGAGLSTEVPSPSKIVFKKEELDTTSKHTTAP
nr:hypothetical protein [Tanacetum cinerariifolium]